VNRILTKLPLPDYQGKQTYPKETEIKAAPKKQYDCTKLSSGTLTYTVTTRESKVACQSPFQSSKN
jgi:hypothetical protein